MFSTCHAFYLQKRAPPKADLVSALGKTRPLAPTGASGFFLSILIHAPCLKHPFLFRWIMLGLWVYDIVCKLSLLDASFDVSDLFFPWSVQPSGSTCSAESNIVLTWFLRKFLKEVFNDPEGCVSSVCVHVPWRFGGSPLVARTCFEARGWGGLAQGFKVVHRLERAIVNLGVRHFSVAHLHLRAPCDYCTGLCAN